MNFYYYFYFAAAAAVLFIFCRIFFKFGIIKKTKPSLSTGGYHIIYTDQKTRRRRKDVVYSKILCSEKYGIKGKPDFLYKKYFGKHIIPIELKSGSIGDDKFPHFGDLMQLTAYFLIVEDVYGVRPRYGKLIYSDYMFKVKNTKKLRKCFLKTTENMRTMLRTGRGECSPDFAKCRHCVCNGTVCEFKQ